MSDENTTAISRRTFVRQAGLVTGGILCGANGTAGMSQQAGASPGW